MALALEHRFGCQRFRFRQHDWSANSGDLSLGTYGFLRTVHGEPKFVSIDVAAAEEPVKYALMLNVANGLGFPDPRELISAALEPEFD